MYLATQKKFFSRSERKRWGIERIINLRAPMELLMMGGDEFVLPKEARDLLLKGRILQDFPEPKEGMNVTSYMVFRDQPSREFYMMMHSEQYGFGINYLLN